ncbi:MAG: hypothetical protein QW165_00075 [Candidatus Woesearchaeota archaeon]
MTAASQSVDDIVKETKAKWEHYSMDKPLTAQQHKEFFGISSAKLDPSIYKGEWTAYRSDSKGYETGNQVLDRMAKRSEDIKDWISEQRYEAEKKIGPCGNYNFRRDTASGEHSTAGIYSGTFEDVARKYLMGEGRELYAHLKGQGRKFYDINRIGTANLEGAIAALAVQGDNAALIGAKDFDRKISQFASNYGISKERAASYIMAHEFVHASQKGKYFDTIAAELDVEHTLKTYFTGKGDMDLAYIAGHRAASVTRNYGRAGMPASIGVSSYGKTAA